MSKVQDVRKSSLTFAPEAGSQRLRDVINKGLTEEIILEGAGQAFEGGLDSCKIILYARTCQPRRKKDMKEIAHLAEKVARRYYEIPKDQRNGKCQIVASTSFIYSEAIHSISVGKNVQQGRLHSKSTYRK